MNFYEFIVALRWQFLIIIILCIVFCFFKKELSGFFRRLWLIRAKDFQVEASKPDLQIQEAKKEEQVSEKEIENSEEPEAIEVPKTLESWRREMILASIIHEKERADKAYEKILELNKDDISRKKDEVLYLRLSFTLGDVDAIGKLSVFLLGSDDIAYEANMALGFCYTHSDDLEKASQFYLKAIDLSHDEDEKTIAISRLSLSLYRDNKKNEAIRVLSEAVSKTSDDKFKYRLYESLADIYEREKDYENRAFVLDKAIELKPNDSELIFKAGYSYAESNYDELSLLHYKNAKSIAPKNAAIQNNLGVLYDNLNLPNKSIACYRESEDLGNTLASANLAYRLIAAGFMSDAKSILDVAIKKDNVHPNVNEALAEIPKKKEREDLIEESKNKFALELRKFFLEFIDAKFYTANKLTTVSGLWKNEDCEDFLFEVVENKIKATWVDKSRSYKHDRKLEGEVFNNSSSIVFLEKEYNFERGEYEYVKKGHGFLFCSPSGKQVKFIQIDVSYGEKKIYTFSQ